MAKATITIPVTFTVELPDDMAQYADSIDVLDAVTARLDTAIAREMLGGDVSTYVTVDGDDLDCVMIVTAATTPSPDEQGVQY